jgi:hypothetical protein
MKKIFTLALAAMLLLGMTTTAFATSTNLDNDTKSTDLGVQAVYHAEGNDDATISVEISWTGLNFTYNGGTQIWDASAHKYVTDTPGGWAVSNASIIITNHSDTILQAGLHFTAEDDFDGIGMIFAAEAPYIGSAYTGENGGEACSITIPLIPDGTLAETITESTAIGTITVSVQPVVGMTQKDISAELAAQYGGMLELTSMKRGDVYLKDQNAIEAIAAALSVMEDPSLTEETALNAALNDVITAFYNGLAIKQ